MSHGVDCADDDPKIAYLLSHIPDGWLCGERTAVDGAAIFRGDFAADLLQMQQTFTIDSS
jgi:hypothetical protein